MALSVVTPDLFASPRPSASVQRVAAIIGCDDATVRRLVAEGSLEGYTLRKRSIRVFLDSVAAFQQRMARPITAKNVDTTKIKRRAVTNAANEAAKRELRAAGYIR